MLGNHKSKTGPPTKEDRPMQIIARDKHGHGRVYGYADTKHGAIRQCSMAAVEYLSRRKDIKALYVFCGPFDVRKITLIN